MARVFQPVWAIGIPGAVPEGHPGLTQRVLEAAERARLARLSDGEITDADGPHAHHWQAILYVCRGCGEFDPPS
jgi:hypothetical protein